MTDSEINKTIAESLGWECISKGSNYDEQLPIWKSPDGKLFAKCPNFLTDPAARDLLQAKLLEEWIIGLYPRKDGLIRADFTNRGITGGFEITDTRERIWALAYLAAHRLEKE